MLNFNEFYILMESLPEEIAFIHSIFKSNFEDTPILIFADYIQEHNNQDALAITIRNIVNRNAVVIKQPIREKLDEIAKTCSYDMNFLISKKDVVFIPKPGSYIPSLQKAYLYNEKTMDWGVFYNITPSSIGTNDINVTDFKYIDIEKVPSDIVQLAFWERLSNKNFIAS